MSLDEVSSKLCQGPGIVLRYVFSTPEAHGSANIAHDAQAVANHVIASMLEVLTTLLPLQLSSLFLLQRLSRCYW